jgi:hypothetical protein
MAFLAGANAAAVLRRAAKRVNFMALILQEEFFCDYVKENRNIVEDK